MDTSLASLLKQTPYQAYSYSYPHKSAYRPLGQSIPLEHVWQQEDKSALFLYLHIPFCEMRCGFCNLFTLSQPQRELQSAYVDALIQHMDSIKPCFESAKFVRFAMGGGTPTFLEARQLNRLLEHVSAMPAMDLTRVPASVEVSPSTATADKLSLLKNFNVDRISIGVQSFVSEEVDLLVRKQQAQQVRSALEQIRKHEFPVLNVDLIYGIPGQSRHSWLDSLKQTLCYQPEEIYLYPLYVRPLTGLNQIELKGKQAYTDKLHHTDHRQDLYAVGRDYLLSQGYEQISMRMFRLSGENMDDVPVYCCQEDGMLGLGSGARSYTRELHYSGEYAVGRGSVKQIIRDYCTQSHDQFSKVDYGIVLCLEEQKRRYLIQSLLLREGLNKSTYFQRFNAQVYDDFDCVHELLLNELALERGGRLMLNDKGIAHSDAIGPWLASSTVQSKMTAYVLQ